MLELLSQFDLEQRGQEGDRTRSLRARLMLLQGNVDSAGRWADVSAAPVPDRPLLWMEEPQVTRAHVLVARGGDADLESALQILGDRQSQPVHGSPFGVPAVVETLTPRELDVLILLQDRLSSKEIAHEFVLSPSTVNRHTANIFGKLGANNRRDAVVRARALGILPKG